jgi:hypothetical protein
MGCQETLPRFSPLEYGKPAMLVKMDGALKKIPCHGHGLFHLSDGHINLAIIPIEPERKIEGPELKPGIYHFGFEVENVDALRDRCNELGASAGVAKRPLNREAEYRVHDPDGNPIDLSQHGWPI